MAYFYFSFIFGNKFEELTEEESFDIGKYAAVNGVIEAV